MKWTTVSHAGHCDFRTDEERCPEHITVTMFRAEKMVSMYEVLGYSKVCMSGRKQYVGPEK
jgi:hypothetical protein